MSQILFTQKRHLTSDEIRVQMNFETVLNMLEELKEQQSTIFETAPMASFEQVTAMYSSVTEKGQFIDEIQFLNHSVN